jgi:hypothetical protein
MLKILVKKKPTSDIEWIQINAIIVKKIIIIQSKSIKCIKLFIQNSFHIGNKILKSQAVQNLIPWTFWNYNGIVMYFLILLEYFL